MFVKNITKEGVHELPLITFNGDIFTIENSEDLRIAVDFLSVQKVIGFDTETRPAFHKGQRNIVALLQLATEEQAFLFRIHHIGLPPELIQILSTENIIKVGVALKDDIGALRKINDFKHKAFVDLQSYVKNFGIENQGLRSISGIVLGHKISKNQQVSNWEADILSEAQLRYAATDAWVALKVYLKLKEYEDIKNGK